MTFFVWQADASGSEHRDAAVTVSTEPSDAGEITFPGGGWITVTLSDDTVAALAADLFAYVTATSLWFDTVAWNLANKPYPLPDAFVWDGDGDRRRTGTRRSPGRCGSTTGRQRATSSATGRSGPATRTCGGGRAEAAWPSEGRLRLRR